MNDLTNALLSVDYTRSYNESLKQSQTFNYEDGTTQTIGYKSVPSSIIDLQYNNISKSAYEAIETAYENNHSNTFLVLFSDIEDSRVLNLRPDNGVFAFIDFSFSTTANQKGLYSGKITLLTSVLFNYTEFNSIYNQPSSYLPNYTENTDFIDVLIEQNPISVTYGYKLNKRYNNIGRSVSTQKDLLKNKKTWKLKFLCEEAGWIKLVTFFRQNGQLGTFGIPLEGYYKGGVSQQYILARFEEDTLKHTQQIGSIYTIEFNIIEVK